MTVALGAQLPGDLPGDKPRLSPAGPREQERLCLRLTGEAPGQPGPNLEHVIQTRRYLTGPRH
jgi:hypothetical protein